MGIRKCQVRTAPERSLKPSLMSKPREVKKSLRPSAPETAMTVCYGSEDKPKKGSEDVSVEWHTCSNLNLKIARPESAKVALRKSKRELKKGRMLKT